MKMGSGGQRGSSHSPNLPVNTDPTRKRGVPCTASRKRHCFTTQQEGRFSPRPAAAQPRTDCHSSAVKSRHAYNSQLPPWTLYSQRPLLTPLLLYKQVFLSISWWSGGQDCVLPVRGVRVPFLDRELSSHTLNCMTKKVNAI